MVRRTAINAWLFGAGLLLTTMGCEPAPEPPEPTLRIAVSTDAAVPDEIDGLEITVTRGGVTKFNEAYDDSIVAALPETLLLFDSEGEPSSGEFRTPIEITVRGTLQEQDVITRRAVTTFAGVPKLFPLRLCMGCASMTCGQDETCTDSGVCSPSEVDINALPRDDGDASLVGAECPSQ